MRYIAGVALACLVLFTSEARADFVQIDPFTDSQTQGTVGSPTSVVLTKGDAVGATRTLSGTTGLLGQASRILNGVLTATFFEGNGSFELAYDFTTMAGGSLDISTASTQDRNGFSLRTFLSNHSDVDQELDIRYRVNGGSIDTTVTYLPGDKLALVDADLPDTLTSLELTFTYNNSGGNGLSSFTTSELLAVPEPGTVGLALVAFGMFGATRLRRRLRKANN